MTVKTQNSYMVSVPPRSSGSEIHAAIAAMAEPHENVRLMAGSLNFATPREICGLRALVEHAAASAEHVDFDCPARGDVHRYLERVDFYEDLPNNVDLSRPRPTVRRLDQKRNLVELIRVRSTDDVETLMNRVSTIAMGQVGPGHVAKTFATAIGAATENVVEHAGSPIGALVAAQRYQRTGLELAVVDLGEGIPTTLARNHNHCGLRDLEAVERSLEDGVSSVDKPGRGTGLWELVEAVARGGNSTLGVGSGRADLTLSWQGGQPVRYATTPGYVIRGTWIWVRLEG
jgi:hypothetical protein